jgi:hypothetical protein
MARDVDDWVRDLEGLGQAPRVAPAWPAERRWWPVSLGLGLAAASLLGVWLATSEVPVGLRGGLGTQPVLELRLAVERGGVAVRLGGPCRVGERVFFRLSSSLPARAHVWVEGPEGRELLGVTELEGSPIDLGGSGGLVAYQFDLPGQYLFRASPDGMGVCRDCPTVAVEVR